MPTTMTPRQRVLAALRGEPVDRIPWIPLCSATYFASLPEYSESFISDGYEGVRASRGEEALAFRVSFYRERLRAEYMQWCAHPGVSRRRERVRTETGEDGDTAWLRYETPEGNLTRAHTRSDQAHTSFPVEDLIKTTADLDAYEYLVKDEVVEPDYGPQARALKTVGEDGVLFPCCPPAPLKDLLLGDMRLEHAAAALADDRARMERLFSAMHERNLEVVRLQAQSPSPVFLDCAVTGLGMVSPSWVRGFYTPYSQEYADILRAAGKICVHHASGEPVLAIADSIVESRIHALYGLAWPGRGGVPISRVRAAVGPAVALSGGIEPSFLATSTEDEVRARTRDVLEDMAGEPGFLMGTADDVPWGTPPALLAAVGETVRECAA